MLTIKMCLGGLVLRWRLDEVHFGIPSLELWLGRAESDARCKALQSAQSSLHTVHAQDYLSGQRTHSVGPTVL